MSYYSYKSGCNKQVLMKICFIQMVFLGCSIGRLFYDDNPFSQQQNFGRKLHQLIGNCSKGSDQILTKYPSLVSLRDPMNTQEPNINVLCGGVLLSTNRYQQAQDVYGTKLKKELPLIQLGKIQLTILLRENLEQPFLHIARMETEQRFCKYWDTPFQHDFNLTIDFDKELQIGERLGSGAFGSVYKAVWLTRNMEVAVKIIHAHILECFSADQKQREKLFNSIHGELKLLGQIDSPHVVKCYGGSLKPPKICLVLEYISNGTLDSFIHNYHGEIPTRVIMRIAQEIAEGLDTLHPTIVHRDLKPLNVLLDDTYQVKLADFGLSKMKGGYLFVQDQGGERNARVYGTRSFTSRECG